MLSSLIIAAGLLIALAPVAAASNASCTAQFTGELAPDIHPFGTVIVVPEVENLTLGGANLGLEVKGLLATADKSACPVAP